MSPSDYFALAAQQARLLSHQARPLHSAHVEAWMSEPVCEQCLQVIGANGKEIARDTVGTIHQQCRECHQRAIDEDWFSGNAE